MMAKLIEPMTPPKSPVIMRADMLTLQEAIGRSAWLGGISLAGLATSLILIAAVDVPFQLWHHHRQLRITRVADARQHIRNRIAHFVF